MQWLSAFRLHHYVEQSSHNPILASCSCSQSQVLESGQQQDEYLAPNPNTNICLLFTIDYVSNQGQVDWFRRPEWRRTMTSRKCSLMWLQGIYP
jgi:hypothetical protein